MIYLSIAGCPSNTASGVASRDCPSLLCLASLMLIITIVSIIISLFHTNMMQVSLLVVVVVVVVVCLNYHYSEGVHDPLDSLLIYF